MQNFGFDFELCCQLVRMVLNRYRSDTWFYDTNHVLNTDMHGYDVCLTSSSAFGLTYYVSTLNAYRISTQNGIKLSLWIVLDQDISKMMKGGQEGTCSHILFSPVYSSDLNCLVISFA